MRGESAADSRNPHSVSSPAYCGRSIGGYRLDMFAICSYARSLGLLGLCVDPLGTSIFDIVDPKSARPSLLRRPLTESRCQLVSRGLPAGARISRWTWGPSLKFSEPSDPAGSDVPARLRGSAPPRASFSGGFRWTWGPSLESRSARAACVRLFREFRRRTPARPRPPLPSRPSRV